MTDDSTFLAEVGQRIAEHWLRLGWSQQDLAEVTGMNRVTISRVERGLQDAGVRRLVAVATAMSCTPNDLLLSVTV